jgi:hypothetical protein
MNDSKYPLVLVFYLDRELLQNQQIATEFTNSVDMMIKQKGYNVMAFFLPTDGEERIDCINPVQLEETDMAHVHKVLDDLTKAFDMPEQK